MTQQLGLDQLVLGTNGTSAIFANNPSNNWQGQGFLLEAPKTFTVSYGGSIYGGKGGGGQTGMYITYDTDTKRITDVGYYKTIEAGTGIGIMGVGAQGGVVDGDKDTLSDTSYNTNVSIGKASITVTTDGKGNVIGISGGPAATIPGISSTEANTTATNLVSDGNLTSVDNMGNSTGSPSP